MSATPRHRSRGRRTGLSASSLLWLSGAVAAVVLSLGVGGTLSTWTTAVVGNPTNTASTSAAVILQETQGTTTCASSSSTSNSSSCTTIDSYGGTATPLSPGGTQSTDVTFANTGAAAASSVKVVGGGCSQSPTAGTNGATNLCTATGELSVALSCSDGSTYNAAATWTDLRMSAGPSGALATLTHTATLAAGATWTCRTTVTLSASASVNDQGITLTQPLTWTLVK